MSIHTSESQLLTFRPSIIETKNSIIIETSFLKKLISLFAYMHKIEIIPSLKKINVNSKFAWFFHSFIQLDFDDVCYIDYSYESWGTSWGRTSSGIGAHDEVERFAVYLVTKNEEKYFVCSFCGEGSVSTGWTGVLLGGDSIVDYAGTQGNESRQFVEYLSELIGVSLGKPIGDSVDMKKCPACGMETSPYDSKCLYCGAELTKEDN